MAVPTPIFVCGAECGLAAVGTAGVGVEHWSSVGGTAPTVVTAPPTPRSARCYRFNPSAANSNLVFTFAAAIGSGGTAVGRCYVYFTTLPNSACSLLVFLGGTSASQRGAYFNSATTAIEAGSSTASLGGGGVVVKAGVWYRVDVKVVWAATHTVDVQVAVVDGPGKAVTQHSAAVAAETCTTVTIGNIAGTTTADYYIDDVIASGTSGDYPIGAGTVIGLYPASDGNHLYDAAGDFNDVGGNLNATSSAEIDTWRSLNKPCSTTINGTTFITNLLGASTEYLEWVFDPLPQRLPPTAQINGLMVVTCNHAASATACVAGAQVVEQGTTNDVYTLADFSEVTIVVAVKAYATSPAGGLWTKAKINNLRFRWGLSNDVNPDPILDAVCFEVDYVPAYPTPPGQYGLVLAQPADIPATRGVMPWGL